MVDGIGRLFMVKEAVNSVAIEHQNDCDCLTCKAANGDSDALAEIYRQVDQ